MERLRQHRENVMDETRAAVAYCNSGSRGSHALNLHAFLSIFHPEMSDEARHALVQDARERDRHG